jgi:Putative adhesin
MNSKQRAARLAVVVVLAGTSCAFAESRQEFRFDVGRHVIVSVLNQYGPISVKPGASKQVVVTAITYSDQVEIDKSQSGNRVGVVSHLLPGADAETGRVDYEVVVPSDASVTLHSTTGPLHAEGLHGDVTLEGASAAMDVRDINDAHVHVKTLNGQVTLTNIRDGHVEITSVSGDVVLTSVNGPLVLVNSNSGKIHYDGEFGGGGEYNLTSHTGDIEAMAPSYASIDVTARSEQGKVENDFDGTMQPKHTWFPVTAGRAFAGTMGKAASSVKLFSISGKIHLKKR